MVGATVRTFYVNTKTEKLEARWQYTDQYVISLGLGFTSDRYRLRFVESLVRRLSLIGHPPPAAVSSNHLGCLRFT